MYYCEQCNYSTIKVDHFKRHRESKRCKRGGGTIIYNCFNCQFVTKNKGDWLRHCSSAKCLTGGKINLREYSKNKTLLANHYTKRIDYSRCIIEFHNERDMVLFYTRLLNEINTKIYKCEHYNGNVLIYFLLKIFQCKINIYIKNWKFNIIETNRLNNILKNKIISWRMKVFINGTAHDKKMKLIENKFNKIFKLNNKKKIIYSGKVITLKVKK